MHDAINPEKGVVVGSRLCITKNFVCVKIVTARCDVSCGKDRGFLAQDTKVRCDMIMH